MKRRRVVFSPRAKSDLLSIFDWIAPRAGSDVAEAYVTRLTAYCESFDLAGERGMPRDDIRAGLRIVGFERRVTIAFSVEESRVKILRLFYGGRDWEDEAF